MTISRGATLPTWFGAITLCLLSAVSAGHATECVSPPFNPISNWCNDCTYEGWMVVRRNQPCERPFVPTANAKTIAELFGDRVVKRAKHGTAAMKGHTFAYAPSRDFVGNDDATIQMAYRRGTETGKFFVHFNVAVE